MLEEFISSCDGRVNPIRMYSAKELEKAIGNTNPVLRHIGDGGVYYKGTYLGGTILIKKFDEGSNNPLRVRNIKKFDEEYKNPRWIRDDEYDSHWVRDEIFDEMAVLSQMNHRNVVKLLGCCLETELPILVYEFVSNGSLADYIDDPRRRISWEDRLRIATQVADALTYMHTATAKPIVLRDLNPSCILLDDNYSAKLIEFGMATSLPLGEETQFVSPVRGMYPFMSPEYLSAGEVTEKVDVYSFGQLLLNLLTLTRDLDGIDRMHAHYWKADAMNSAVDSAISSIKDKFLLPELAAGNWSQGKTEQLMVYAVLASNCLEYKGEERPTMKEVVQELRRIIKSSFGTRNINGTEKVSMKEVVQELRRIIRSSLESNCPTEMETEMESFSDTESISNLSDDIYPR